MFHGFNIPWIQHNLGSNTPLSSSGGSKISVTLSKIRTIKVTIIGANRPATYRLSSLATVFNALYVSGGPTAFGSFREIELMRDNKLFKKIDLYDYITTGELRDDVRLTNNDIVSDNINANQLTDDEIKKLKNLVNKLFNL